jgi:hypothetical protein
LLPVVVAVAHLQHITQHYRVDLAELVVVVLVEDPLAEVVL